MITTLCKGWHLTVTFYYSGVGLRRGEQHRDVWSLQMRSQNKAVGFVTQGSSAMDCGLDVTQDMIDKNRWTKESRIICINNKRRQNHILYLKSVEVHT